MFFFPQGVSPDIIENYFKIIKENENKNKKANISKEEIKDRKRMAVLKREMDKFTQSKSPCTSMSGMMYYGALFSEYAKLEKKYKLETEYDIINIY